MSVYVGCIEISPFMSVASRCVRCRDGSAWSQGTAVSKRIMAVQPAEEHQPLVLSRISALT
eukprot:2416218-Rhodomonas_salina.1